jgi:hypothetical protein
LIVVVGCPAHVGLAHLGVNVFVFARIALAAISKYTILVLLLMFFFSFSRDLATVSKLRVIHIDSTEWIGARCR